MEPDRRTRQSEPSSTVQSDRGDIRQLRHDLDTPDAPRCNPVQGAREQPPADTETMVSRRHGNERQACTIAVYANSHETCGFGCQPVDDHGVGQ